MLFQCGCLIVQMMVLICSYNDTGENKTIKPVTVATYQILTWRPDKDGAYPHFSIFHERSWGLIIYDEVHMLPAPVFRVVADLQAVRRVGLTATLVREDGCEGYVFSLVGPKRYDVPWKELEQSGWIATAECIEVRVDLPVEKEIEYVLSAAIAKCGDLNDAKDLTQETIRDVKLEIKECEEAMYEHTGYAMDPLFRPPKGEYSERTVAISKELGYKTVLWASIY